MHRWGDQLQGHCHIRGREESFNVVSIKHIKRALAGVTQWIEHWPVDQRSLVRFLVRAHAWIVGLVPGWGHARGNYTLILLFLPLFPFLFF